MVYKKIGVALSGGVDSSVAAHILQKSGYEVIGLHMKLWKDTDFPADRKIPDISLITINEIEQFCHRLNIPFYIVDLEEDFYDNIVEYFINEYRNGRTPNPCVLCNKFIKFGLLRNKAISLGVDSFATGHYARIHYDGNKYHLKKAIDLSKDQSYFLYRLGQNELVNTIFPLGTYYKRDIVKIAKQEEFKASNKKSSQDICFISGKLSDFLQTKIKSGFGNIKDESGNILGKHRGHELYTVGQRCGLGISVGKRLYIKYIEAINNSLIVASGNGLFHQSFKVEDINWISEVSPNNSSEIKVRIRYRSEEADAIIYPLNSSAMVSTKEPLWAITPGQSAVFYQNDEVIGGGIISGVQEY